MSNKIQLLLDKLINLFIQYVEMIVHLQKNENKNVVCKSPTSHGETSTNCSNVTIDSNEEKAIELLTNISTVFQEIDETFQAEEDKERERFIRKFCLLYREQIKQYFGEERIITTEKRARSHSDKNNCFTCHRHILNVVWDLDDCVIKNKRLEDIKTIDPVNDSVSSLLSPSSLEEGETLWLDQREQQQQCQQQSETILHRSSSNNEIIHVDEDMVKCRTVLRPWTRFVLEIIKPFTKQYVFTSADRDYMNNVLTLLEPSIITTTTTERQKVKKGNDNNYEYDPIRSSNSTCSTSETKYYFEKVKLSFADFEPGQLRWGKDVNYLLQQVEEQNKHHGKHTQGQQRQARLQRTILVDDNPRYHMKQPNNGILVDPFPSIDQYQSDNVLLLKVLPTILKCILLLACSSSSSGGCSSSTSTTSFSSGSLLESILYDSLSDADKYYRSLLKCRSHTLGLEHGYAWQQCPSSSVVARCTVNGLVSLLMDWAIKETNIYDKTKLLSLLVRHDCSTDKKRLYHHNDSLKLFYKMYQKGIKQGKEDYIRDITI